MENILPGGTVTDEQSNAHWKHQMDTSIALIQKAGIKNMQDYSIYSLTDITYTDGTGTKPWKTRGIWVTHFTPSKSNENFVGHTSQIFDMPGDVKHYMSLVRSSRRDYLKWTDVNYIYLNDLAITDPDTCSHSWYCDICSISVTGLRDTQHGLNLKNPTHKSYSCEDCKTHPHNCCAPCECSIDISMCRMKCNNPNNRSCADFDMCMECYKNSENTCIYCKRRDLIRAF